MNGEIRMSKIPPKSELVFLYNVVKLSTHQIGRLKEVHHSTVEAWMDKYKIPRRTLSQATQNAVINERALYSDWSKLGTVCKIPVSNLPRVPKQNISVSLPLEFLVNETDNNLATITLVLSDLHLGHSDFLPDTFYSTVETLKIVLKWIQENFDIKMFNIVLNGDIVSGREVYHTQFLDNILGRGHWQVFLAEVVLKNVLNELHDIAGIDNVYLTKGQHESLAENYVLYLKRTLSNDEYDVQYRSKGFVLNIANPIGDYNIFFTHGRGYGEYGPVSPIQLRDLQRMLIDQKHSNIHIERCCLGHTHWLGTNIECDGGLIIDVAGGFQKWELSHSQRPSGMLLYLHTAGETSVIPIRPNIETETKEKNDPTLEYKNIKFAGEMLMKHVKEIEGVGTEERTDE